MEVRPPNIKPKLTEVNSYLTCYLCKGYYIDATTIVECLHSYCKSCIIQHLQLNNYCPICDLMINTAKPNIKPDKTLQDIVYKLVPGLYASEMCRRRLFWTKHPEESQKVSCPEARGHMTERIIFSPQDAISLSIEYTSDEQQNWPQQTQQRQQRIIGGVCVGGVGVGTGGEGGTDSEVEVPLRRYLQCPAMLRVEHLKKFICTKYSVDSQHYHVDILHKRVPLPDHYTLMDIAYIYSWKRNEPMKFLFRITDINLVSELFDYFDSSKATSASPEQHFTPSRCHRTSRQSTNSHEKKVQVQNSDKKNDIEISINNKNCDKRSDKKSQIIDNKNDAKIKSDSDGCVVKKLNSDKKSNKNIKSKDEDIKKNSDKGDKNESNKQISENSELTNGSVEFKSEKVLETDGDVNENCEQDNKKLVPSETKELENTVDFNMKKSNEKTSLNSKTIDSNPSLSNNEFKVPNFDTITVQTEPNVLKSNIDNTSKIESEFHEIRQKIEQPDLNLKLSSPVVKTSENIQNNTKKLREIKMKIEQFDQKSSINKNLPEIRPKIEQISIDPKSPIENQNEDDIKKCQFFNSIQLTATNTSPPKNQTTEIRQPLKPEIKPELKAKVIGQKRKYVRKSDKPQNAKKIKLSELNNKTNKLPGPLAKFKLGDKIKNDANLESELKVRAIKNPIVRHMMNNLNKQTTNVNKIVEQTDSLKTNPQNQNEKLQSLIDSCKLNIPSSLSITLTESVRNEDGSIVDSKPAPIKPVQNYIEILKLPETIDNSQKSNDDITETPKKSDALTLDKLDANKNDVPKSSDLISPSANKNQKHTFQTMFEEAIKKNESMKAQLFEIQNKAKKAELAKKANAINNKLILPKPVKKQQSNALDLSSKTSPKSLSPSPDQNSIQITNSTPNVASSTNPNVPSLSPILSPNISNLTTNVKTPVTTSHTTTSNSTNHSSHKKNILEIAHQLSKRSRLELPESPTLKIPESPNTVSTTQNVSPLASPNSTSSSNPKQLESPPKQIIINSNFISGGSISINKSPKKILIPRLPVSKVPTPKLNPPNIRNGNLLKFSNYTAQLASNNANQIHQNKTTSPTKISPKSSNSSTTKPESVQTINGLTPNQILEKYNITNLAQFNANLNQAQLAFLMMSHQLEMQRLQQQNNQKHWLNNPNILAHYESYVQSLKSQQNQICGNGNKN